MPREREKWEWGWGMFVTWGEGETVTGRYDNDALSNAPFRVLWSRGTGRQKGGRVFWVRKLKEGRGDEDRTG